MPTPSKKQVRVRLAPSPTGPFHVGTARTALFNWLFAKQNGGAFVLRIEDTDTERSEKRFETEIFDSLKWLGLDWDEGPQDADSRGQNADERGLDWDADQRGKSSASVSVVSAPVCDFGPYRQSERKEIYKTYIERLLAERKAYYCYCTKEELEAERQTLLSQGLPPKYGGHCRNLSKPPAGKKPEVIRFKTPEASAEFKDIIRGKIAFNAGLLGDMVIAKDASTPLYNLANVIDDELMDITHVIRGEDHLSNTQKQILFIHALGFKEVAYAHLPLILNPDRSKMSKRFGDTALLEYRAKGYLPEAMVNFLVLLGWHPKTDREILSKEDMVAQFDLGRVQKAGAIFGEEKLEWLQREYLQKLSIEELASRLAPILEEKKIVASPEFAEKVVGAGKARIKNIREFADGAGFFFALPKYDGALLLYQGMQTPAEVKRILTTILDLLSEIKTEEIKREAVAELLKDFVAQEGRGAVLWPLRVALSGQRASPDPLEIIEVVGLEESKKRIGIAIEKTELLSLKS